MICYASSAGALGVFPIDQIQLNIYLPSRRSFRLRDRWALVVAGSHEEIAPNWELF